MDAKRPADVPAAAASSSKKQKTTIEPPKGVNIERPCLVSYTLIINYF